MAKLLQMFPGVVPVSESAGARAEAAGRLRERFLSADFIGEIYGSAAAHEFGRMDDLMPTTDEVAGRWGNGDYKIYDDMGRNVLRYRALHDGRIDVVTGLPMVVLPGKKGDPESEAAAEEVRSQWENIEERMIALKAAGKFIERGFCALENIYGIHTRGASKGQIGIIAMIDRPNSWIGFDYLNRPYFKQRKNARDPVPIQDFKVTFGRYGSLHTKYGEGIGQYDYPSVWTIDAVMKRHLEAVERAGYLPLVAIYPDNSSTWPRHKAQGLKNELVRQWKNVVVIPGEVDSVQLKPLTEMAYASTNASGASNIEIIKTLEACMAHHIQGSQYSSNEGTGAYAKDYVADAARLYKAPGDAACYEAMLNRGFVRPIMLVNRPQMDESLWPRFAIDASFGQDLELLLRIMESGAKMGAEISTVTFSETFKIPLAQPGEAVLKVANPQPLIAGGPVEPDPDSLEGAIAKAERSFSEGGAFYRISLTSGGEVHFAPEQAVYTENRGLVRASMLESGDRPVVPLAMIRKSA